MPHTNHTHTTHTETTETKHTHNTQSTREPHRHPHRHRHRHPHPHTQPFPSLRRWNFPENLKRTLMSRTLASDPKALCGGGGGGVVVVVVGVVCVEEEVGRSDLSKTSGSSSFLWKIWVTDIFLAKKATTLKNETSRAWWTKYSTFPAVHGVLSPRFSTARSYTSILLRGSLVWSNLISLSEIPADLLLSFGSHSVSSSCRLFASATASAVSVCGSDVRQRRVDQPGVACEDYAPVSPPGIVPFERSWSAQSSSVASHFCACSSWPLSTNNCRNLMMMMTLGMRFEVDG